MENMPTSISESISDLANQVAHLAQSIDRLIARAERPQQQSPPLKQLAATKKTITKPAAEIEPSPNGTVEADPSGLLEEGRSTQKPPHQPAENVFATSVAGLYERLGGLLGTALQPDSEEPICPRAPALERRENIHKGAKKNRTNRLDAL
jgi:hypothetical protein